MHSVLTIIMIESINVEIPPCDLGKDMRSLLSWVLLDRCFFLFQSNSLEAIACWQKTNGYRYFQMRENLWVRTSQIRFAISISESTCEFFERLLVLFHVWGSTVEIRLGRLCSGRLPVVIPQPPSTSRKVLSACIHGHAWTGTWLNSSYMRCTCISFHDLLQTLSTIKGFTWILFKKLLFECSPLAFRLLR